MTLWQDKTIGWGLSDGGGEMQPDKAKTKGGVYEADLPNTVSPTGGIS